MENVLQQKHIIISSSSYLRRDKRLGELKKIVVKILTPQKPAESQVVIASSVMQGRRPLGVNSPGGNTPLNKMIGNLKRNATKQWQSVHRAVSTDPTDFPFPLHVCP